MENSNLQLEALALLKELITIPSFSKEEHGTAGAITKFLALQRVEHSRVGNNVFALNKHFDESKPTILLNSHHDTVKPNKAYTLDPFHPQEKDGNFMDWVATMRVVRWWLSSPLSCIFITKKTCVIILHWQQRQKKRSREQVALNIRFRFSQKLIVQSLENPH